MNVFVPRVVLIIACILGVPGIALGWDPARPDDPAAHAAAQAALTQAQKPRSLLPDIRELPGLRSSGLALQKNIEDLQQALTTLNAEILEQEIRISLSADLLFDFDQYQVKPEADAELRTLTTVLRETDSGWVRIVGHTDSMGGDAYNLRLSEQRAESVKRWLLGSGELGVDVIIETSGQGENEPVAPNSNTDGSDNAAGRALNRRVELVIQAQKPFTDSVITPMQ